MESPEVLAVWAQAVGGAEADVQQFVAAWRALESLFEFEDIVDGAEPVPEGSQIQVDEAAPNPAAAAASDSAADQATAAGSRDGGSLLPSAALADWEFASQGAMTVLQPMVVASPFLAEPLADGDLSMEEVQALWAIHVGDPRASCDVAQFGQLWLAVDDLFEEDDEGDDDEVDGSEAAMSVNGDFTVLPNDDDDDRIDAVPPPAPAKKANPTAMGEKADGSAGENNSLTGEALQEWRSAQAASSSSSGGSSGAVTKAAVLACAFVAEPLADGDLLPEEVEEFWASATGSASATTADAESFGRFWAAVDDLFEDDDDDEDDDIDANAAAAGTAAAVASRAMGAPPGLSGSALREWRVASAASGGVFAAKEAVLACDFVTEPLADGDLLSEEVELLWVEHVGAAAESADVETFGRFWTAVDDLFEDDDDDEDGAGNGGAGGGNEEDASLDLDGSYAACRAALVEALSTVPRKGLDASEEQRETLAKLCDELDRHPAQVHTTSSMLLLFLLLVSFEHHFLLKL